MRIDDATYLSVTSILLTRKDVCKSVLLFVMRTFSHRVGGLRILRDTLCGMACDI